MALSVSLNNALSGLRAAQSGMQTVTHNIANVNTPGYVRKTAEQVSVSLAGFGAGVEIGEIRRQISIELSRDLRNITSGLNDKQTREQYLAGIEQLFGTPEGDSAIGATLANFRSALESLSAAPEDFSRREIAVRAGQAVAVQLNDLSRSVQSLRLNADQAIAAGITTVNTQLSRIAELNSQIVRGLAVGQDITDLEDQRDQAVMAIAEHLQVSTYVRGNGALVVGTAAGRTLVDGATVHAISYTPQATVTATTVFNSILLDGTNITAEFVSGKLAALVTQRDLSLPQRTAELNQLALQLRNSVFSTNLATTDDLATAAINEINRFFTGVDPASIDNAGTIRVHAELVANSALLNNLTAARELANAASSQAVVFAAAGGLPALTTGFTAYGDAILARLASESAAAQEDVKYHTNLHVAMQAKVSESSGVNLDEELAHMVELQRAYGAAARLIQTANEMLQTLEDIFR